MTNIIISTLIIIELIVLIIYFVIELFHQYRLYKKQIEYFKKAINEIDSRKKKEN